MRGRRTAAALAIATSLVAASPAVAQNEALERERLELDIARLEREADWPAAIQRWLPALSIIVAALAAGYGIWRYFDERRRGDERQTEEGITRNLERLTDRPDDANPSARAITALNALNALAPANGDDRARQRREVVTRAVRAIVEDDLTTLEISHEARLPVICLDEWSDFDDIATSDAELCGVVAARYVHALKAVEGRAPIYVSQVRRRPDGAGYEPPAWTLSGDDALLFPAVVTGFERFATLLPDGPVRDAVVADFSQLARTLGRELFDRPRPVAAPT